MDDPQRQPNGAAPEPLGWPRPPSRAARRRWPWVVTAVLALVLGAVAAGIAWEQREVAQAWQERAEVLAGQRDEAVGRTEALQRHLDETFELLELSESDVVQLEERIRELAGEKARAEDEATTVQVERDVFVELSATVTDAVDALDVCVERLFALLNDSVAAYNAAVAGEFVDVEPLNAASEATTAFCNEARLLAARAGAAADQLLRQ